MMKRILLVLICMLGFAGSLSAQKYEPLSKISWWKRTVYYDSTNDGKVKHEELGYRRADQIYVGAVTASVILAVVYPKYNTDIGGYQDKWIAGDKGGHFLIHWTVANIAQDAGMKGWKAASLGCFVAGPAYEWVQKFNGEIHHGSGFVSGKDIVMNCSGAYGNWAYRSLVGKLKHRKY